MAKKTKRQAQSAARLQRYRKLYAQAKKKGLVKGDKNARTLVPSRYMKTKLNSLEQYLGPDYQAVKAPKQLREVWKDAPSEIVPKTVNKRILVKKEPGQRISTRNGILTLKTHLEGGTFEQIPLPVNAKTLNDFKAWVQENRYYNDILKHRDEVFNFRIFGNASYNSFGDLEALIEELEKYTNYDSEMPDDEDWGDSEEFFTHFELFRSFRDWKFENRSEAARARKSQEQRERRRQRARNRLSPEERAAYDRKQREMRAARRAAQPGYQLELAARRAARKNETPEQKEARRKKERARIQALRDARRAQGLTADGKPRKNGDDTGKRD